MTDSGEDAEASSADASVLDAHFQLWIIEAFEAGPVNGGGESDVGGILSVAGLFDEVRFFEGTAVVGDALGREGEGFDSPCSARSCGIEVNTDKDGVLIFVGEFDSFLQGQENIGAASHDDFKATFDKALFEEESNLEVVAFLGAEGVGRAGIFSSVAGVDDDSVEGLGSRNLGRTEDGVDDLKKIGHGHVIASESDDGVTEDKLYVVHEHLLATGLKLEGELLVLKNDLSTRLGHAREIVELFDLAERDILVSTILFHLPLNLLSASRK